MPTKPASDFFAKISASFLGVGYIPAAPGTFGSLAGLGLIFWVPPSYVVITTLFLTALGFWVAPAAAQAFDSKDPKKFVLDEVCGMMLTMIGAPVSVPACIAGFVFFRLFDIFKPWPISILQKKSEPWAIMADDLAAGVLAWVCLRVFLAFFGTA